MGKLLAGKILFSKGRGANMIKWKENSVVPFGASVGSEHMFSFEQAYKCTAVMEWMFAQKK